MKENQPLKIVTFNFRAIAYDLVAKWIQNSGNQHVLAVTTPGPKSRPTTSYKQIIDSAPRDVDILITTRLKSVAIPLIRSLQPDLIICFSFPYSLSKDLCEIPKYGAINIHPTVLPLYRGPNIMRQFYEGSPTFGATAHWIAEEYDTGNILSQKSETLPKDVTRETIIPTWLSLISQSISEGAEQAIAGDSGLEQDHTKSSYAAPFTEQECWLNWNDSQNVIQRKELALNVLSPGTAKAVVNQDKFIVTSLETLPEQDSSAAPGECIEHRNDTMIIQAGDGPICIQVQPLSA